MIGARWRCYQPDCPQNAWNYASDFTEAAETARQHHAEPEHHNVSVWPEEEGGT